MPFSGHQRPHRFSNPVRWGLRNKKAVIRYIYICKVYSTILNFCYVLKKCIIYLHNPKLKIAYVFVYDFIIFTISSLSLKIAQKISSNQTNIAKNFEKILIASNS